VTDAGRDPDLRALARATEPDAARVDAVWRGAEARRAGAALPVGVSLGLIVSLVAAGAALVALLASADPDRVPPPRVVEAEAWTTEQPLPHVALTYRGDGVLDTAGAPVLAWRWGEVVVDVTPGAGPPVTVRTQEATIAVVGTRFSVTRSVLGTETRVERGEVLVTCAEGRGARPLGAGGSAWCLPTAPAQLLARVDRLVADGAATEAIRGSIEAGLARAGDQPLVAAELLLRRMEQDAAAGRSTREDALAYLALGATARRQEVLTQLAGETYQAGGCDAGRASLEALFRETGAPEVGILLATCLAETEPARARRMLQDALQRELEPSWRESAEAWARSLGG
jgi:hypothetical protein